MALLWTSLWALVALTTFHTTWSGLCLYRNYLKARKLGVPVRLIPIDHVNTFWLLVDKKVITLARRLPGFLGNNNFTRFNYRGWHEETGMEAHDEMGEAFVLVTPSRNWLYVANPDSLMDVYKRGKDFPRWVEITKVLNVFGGPTVGTAKGEHWKTHRRIVNSYLSEQVHSIVWSESARLGEQMAKYWGRKQLITTVDEDTSRLSLNILSKACFGQTIDFERSDGIPETSASASFRISLLTVMENALLIVALTPKFFQKWWLPMSASWRRIGNACVTFQQHMTEHYIKDLQDLKSGYTKTEPSLMTSMIRSSLEGKVEKRLTEEEIYGNMFVVSFAGHDTTAHLITWAMFYLAANPHIQDWLHEELRDVLGDRPGESWDYKKDFPRLKRCLATLHETLRLQSPVAEAKWTDGQAQSLNMNGQVLTIPEGTLIVPSYWYVQKHAKYWGADGLEWKPKRWIANSCQDHHDQQLLSSCEKCSSGGERLLQPPSRGNFLGWSEGTRDCPAKRFSQVEWVAIMASLFREWRVEPRLQDNESEAEASQRVLNFIKEDTEYGGLLLQLMHPERVPLVFKRRQD